MSDKSMTSLDKKIKMYKCEICDKEFKSNGCLKQHFRNVHNPEEEHQCNICQKVFRLKSQLELHVKSIGF